MKRVSKLQALLQTKCPHCREGNMFEYSAFNYLKFHKMHKNCPKCGFQFEVEPGVFYGAMYISYAFSMAIFLGFGLFTYVIFGHPEPWVYVTVILTAVLTLFTLSFRYSRALMLYLFFNIPYKPLEE